MNTSNFLDFLIVLIYRLYKEQAEKGRTLNERLGVGIGAFQAATNIFLNGCFYFYFNVALFK